jgi:hypothetical protein
MVAAVMAAALTPATAGAFTNDYCGVLINSGTWCGDGSNHTYDSNRATYTGAGSVYVCERLLYADTSLVRPGGLCSPSSQIYHYYGANGSTNYEAEVSHSSGTARHTIYGQAVA